MAEKIPDVRQSGRNGNGSHGYHSQAERDADRGERMDRQARGDMSEQASTSAPIGREGRYWTEAQQRGRSEDRDRRFEPLARDVRLGGSGYPRDGEERDFGDEDTPYDRMPSEFEHARAGFRDFGTPSATQGRELRERYSERDFRDRDDRVAGRSGSSYRPDQMADETSASTGFPRRRRTPEEEWERTHYRGRAEERRSRIWEREPATARDIMTANPRTVRRDANLREVAVIMRDENCGVVPVVDAGNRIIGLVTDRDMVMRTVDAGRSWSEIRVEDVMSDDLHCVMPDEPVQSLIELMGRKQVRRVPVVDRGDRLLGMIAMADIANRANDDEDLQHALDKISKRHSFWSRLWS